VTEIHIVAGKPVCPECGTVLQGIATATYVRVPLRIVAKQWEFDATDGQLNEDYLDALDCPYCLLTYEITEVTLVFD
jgi:hypothetical protein